jgi:catechol 2,3-dioxygenase-like lactoylglutathione lyase family enzyme
MKIRNTSHIAIGVSNMERALRFYRDLLGLRVTLDDPQENPGGMLSRVQGGQQPRTRHGVYLRWEDGPNATFIVLSQDQPI